MNRFSDSDSEQFSRNVAKELIGNENFIEIPDRPETLQLENDDQEIVNIDLMPFKAKLQPVTASKYFADIASVSHLLSAYEAAKNDHVFENNIEAAVVHVSSYADQFLKNIFQKAKHTLTDSQAKVIGEWLANLDVYTAVKSVESLLNSKADVALIELAQEKSWTVHFDHLAIRCGSRANQDAERIVEMLKQQHEYVSPHVQQQAFYQFPDGWNAYPLYKILDNGQVLRLFIDQSDASDKSQIIQHWNKVYGYTAHHLAIRATTYDEEIEERVAISLDDVMQALKKRGIEILTPTGGYTHGLLLQVFTRPELNLEIPDELKNALEAYGQDLHKKIQNGKLLEIVSRRELPLELAQKYFALYGIKYNSHNPLHSAPVYQYFLPAQAAHVIRTSVQTN